MISGAGQPGEEASEAANHRRLGSRPQPGLFVRIHRSYIVNLERVRAHRALWEG